MLICNAEYGGNVDVLLDEKHQRITNGILAAPCQFSWQAALIVDNAFFCGGSLISQQWVLTATLCT
jgi:secreted trypsin-like serine protease